ncbi:MAG: SPOR domain-containing protein [Burkholderiaceae bacterium]
MGLFSRNESAPGSGRRSASRSSVSSETQTRELRGRARRRLIGALALVIAAVIVVPMLLDTEPAPDQNKAPLVVPAITPPTPESIAPATAPAGADTPADTDAPLPTPDGVLPDSGAAGDAAEPPAEVPPPKTRPRPESAPSARAESGPVPQAKSRPSEKSPETKADAKSESKSNHVKRTDDGSAALALLEGRQPRQASPERKSAQGNYTLQIAAYSTDKDAQVRRDRLVASGVTNAYIETATSGGKATYRLRVGPFPTREAAQAAQARLRALGYDNGFISAK